MNTTKMDDRIARFPDKTCGRGANPEQIAAVEKRLGLRFPKSYRHYLQNYGWCRFSHQELYGLGTDVPSHLELIRNTLSERQDMGPPLSPLLVPVMNDGAGNHYCLDTSKMKADECPVVFWDHELGEKQKPGFVAASFDEWLVELLTGL
jgi:cell wall assembly regulator SMI1